jgi:integrative and conjugative element protein (TIGR02256 family)
VRFTIGDSGEVVEFSASVLERFEQHRQRRFWQAEAGGQLFANLAPGLISIAIATGPRPTDRRTPFSYVPDREAEHREIAEMRPGGWHYVGDWHTHPQAVPSPSGRDLRTVISTVQKSQLVLAGVLMVIVGSSAFPSGLYVGVSDGEGLYSLAADW